METSQLINVTYLSTATAFVTAPLVELFSVCASLCHVYLIPILSINFKLGDLLILKSSPISVFVRMSDADSV